jgi:hypothetical protein
MKGLKPVDSSNTSSIKKLKIKPMGTSRIA